MKAIQVLNSEADQCVTKHSKFGLFSFRVESLFPKKTAQILFE